MASVKITVLREDYKLLFSETVSNSSKIKTPWIKGSINKPSLLVVEQHGHRAEIPLNYKVNKTGKECLIGYDKAFNKNIKAVFSYGVDPDRPSFCGTISIYNMNVA